MSLKGIAGVGFLALVGAAGFWWHQKETAKDRMIEEQRRVIAAMERKLELAWADELVADVRVRKIETDPGTGEKRMTLTFIQYAPGTEQPVLTRTMTLPGEEFYIDSLVVRFDRALVEAGDGLRGKSLLLFRRAFGDRQRPVDGVPLFRMEGDLAIPEILQVDPEPSEFERDIWARFWTLANDPAAAVAEGVRVAQGEAPHIRAVPGQVYKLSLRASGGLEITPRLPLAAVGGDDDEG